jgi:hypothetical protein
MRAYGGVEMKRLRLVRQHKVIVTIHYTRVLCLIGFWGQRLKTEHGTDVLFTLQNSHVMPYQGVSMNEHP